MERPWLQNKQRLITHSTHIMSFHVINHFLPGCCASQRSYILNEDHFAGSNNTELFSKVVLNDMLNSANYEKMMDDSDSHVASNVARLKSDLGDLAAAT